ncbi:MAG: HIT domain-containing protein [Alphaproteobacteria bacterium]|nr:HIT domain-containing protein [Alphaproteobacteria bacterium]
MFKLLPALADKIYIGELPFCTVLMENASEFVWLFLVPRKENAFNMTHLTHNERIILMSEIEQAESALIRLFHPDQTNVAMIGNITPQLHVHIICRYKTDPVWPSTVWGHKFTPYSETKKSEIIALLRKELACQT